VGEHRRFLDEVIALLEESGYRVALPHRVLNASHYGVPQDRKRLFLMGAKRGLPLPAYPAPTTNPAGGKPIDPRLERGPSVRDAIGDLPDAEAFPALVESDTVRVQLGEPSEYARRLRGLSNEYMDFSYRRRFDRGLLTSSLRADHTPLSRQRFAATAWGETEPVSRFHKLDPEGVCNTLRAGTASDRGAFTSPRPIHYEHARCITVREAARLHSYPDWFRFHVTKWHGFRQIGNSVPPMLARAVAAQIMAALGVYSTIPEREVELGSPELLSMTMADAAMRYGVPVSVIAKRARESHHSAPMLLDV
jgi:DNA (cytosine-5)-methyltransferase 1